MEVVAAARKQRADHSVPPQRRVIVTVSTRSEELTDVVTRNEAAVLELAHGESLHVLASGHAPSGLIGMAETISCYGMTHAVYISAKASRQELDARRSELKRGLDRISRELQRLESKLATPGFMRKAPEAVVRKAQARRDELQSESVATENLVQAITEALGDRGT